MEKRDFLLNQIEQLGKVLAKILSDFLKLKSDGNGAQGIEISNERFQSELDIDIEELLTLNSSELKSYLETRNLTDNHIEIISDYLFEVGKMELEIHDSKSKLTLEKAYELLDLADDISKTTSFQRISKKNELKNLLQNN